VTGAREASLIQDDAKFRRLIEISRESTYSVHDVLDWSEQIPSDVYWMSPELLSLHGTPHFAALSEGQRRELSKWEFINYCSVNMYGERELVAAVLTRLYRPAFRTASEYFHHFIDEENKHMWFFARFALQYGGKLYPDKRVRTSSYENDAVDDFVTFAKITIFEEIGDYLNVAMMKDVRLPPIIRELNRVHHSDEGRHLSMGRKLLEDMHRSLRSACAADELLAVERYLKRYMINSVETFYNPYAYLDAGIADAYRVRREVIALDSRKSHHAVLLNRIMSFLVSRGIFSSNSLYAEEDCS
jgi:hypothetical protein